MSGPIKDAANSLPGCECTPMQAIVLNCADQLCKEYRDIADADLRITELVQVAVLRGVELANVRLGKLIDEVEL